MPVFHFDRGQPREIVSLMAHEGERLARVLRKQAGHPSGIVGEAVSSAAGKIEAGLQHGESAPIELTVNEEDAVFEAVGNLRGERDFSGRLEKLERILREKIEREHD
jgi:hypothetical protein